MPGVILVLGTVVFQAFEVPSGIRFGGRQLTAIHQLIGGQRVVDCMGPSDSEISFSGVFSGSDATERARMLDSLRIAGTPVRLTWDAFYYTVILKQFDGDYENSVWIPYRISCAVVRDEATALVQGTNSLLDQALANVTEAASQSDGAGIDFTNIQTLLAAPDATSLGSAAFVTAQSAIGSTQSAIAARVGVAEATLQSLISGNPDPDTPESLAANVLASATAAQQLAALSIGGAYLGKAALTLSNAST